MARLVFYEYLEKNRGAVTPERMIRSILKRLGLLVFIKYLRKKYFPSASQLADNRLIPQRLKFYEQFIRKGDLCFDVGANIGNRTEIFLKLGAHVVAVEPQDECAEMLKLRFNNKIQLIQGALGDKEGEEIIFISETSEVSSLSKDWIDTVSQSRFSNVQWDRQKKVSVTTLDNMIKQYGKPKFCKIDVEGYEENVLFGLSSAIPFVSFEYTIPERLNNVAGCLARLSTFGQCSCNFTIGENMKLEYSNWVTSEELLRKLKEISSQAAFGDVYVKFE
jgi:FkbM family methyltransferase